MFYEVSKFIQYENKFLHILKWAFPINFFKKKKII